MPGWNLPRLSLGLVLVVLLASGCQTTAQRADSAPSVPKGTKVLMMSPDVELYEVQASGLLELKADWTEQARQLVSAAVGKRLHNSGAIIVPYETPGEIQQELAHNRLIGLHRAVGGAIRQHRSGPLALPSKHGKLDWTLGPGAQLLRDEFGTDYALFLHIRDSYTSAGRAAVMVAAALFGVAVTGGQQIGFVSLVDLRTGQVVWVNHSFSAEGDLRTPEPATEAVRQLLAEFPI